MVSTRVDATSKLKQADAALAAARKVIAQHGVKLSAARAQVKALRAKAGKGSTKAAKAAFTPPSPLAR